MIGDRLYKAARLIQPNGAIFTSIDTNERKSLEVDLDYAFSRHNRVEEIIWIQNSTKSQSPTYSNNHEYVEVYCRDLDTVKRDEKMFREPKPGYSPFA